MHWVTAEKFAYPEVTHLSIGAIIYQGGLIREAPEGCGRIYYVAVFTCAPVR